ncbi:MAG: helix-turn-helix domain-containing protein [Lentisphaeria bacterium]|nr:helix-turn-helix domain-containing protein [Lentisphaeria bacterium]
MINYTILDMPHLERVKLGIKRIRSGHHREMNFHDHRFSEITLIQSPNGAVHWAEGHSFPLTRGDIILMHPGKMHAYEHAGQLELFNILYEPDKLPLPLLDGNSMNLFSTVITSCGSDNQRQVEKPILHLSEPQMVQAEYLAGELEKALTGNAPGKNLRSFAIFIDLLTLICQAGGGVNESLHPDEKLTSALWYINRNFRQVLEIGQLAKTANMSRRNFFRKFRELTGNSPLQYIKNRRLSLAEELLKTTNLSLSEIAYECGFYDSNHMNRMFKQHFKCSPGTMRKSKQDAAAFQQLPQDKTPLDSKG